MIQYINKIHDGFLSPLAIKYTMLACIINGNIQHLLLLGIYLNQGCFLLMWVRLLFHTDFGIKLSFLCLELFLPCRFDSLASREIN